LVSTERFFQGLSVAVKTVGIDEELMEIWLNEVCDRWLADLVSDGWSRLLLKPDYLGRFVVKCKNTTEVASCASTNNLW